MGKGGAAKNKMSTADDDDAQLNAAIAENQVLQAKAASEAAASASAAAASAAATAKLDKLPVFTVANPEGKPLQFKIGGKPMSIFYADIEAAKTRLAETKRANTDPTFACDLVTVSLGSAYELSCAGKAMIVPGLADLKAAGAPDDAQPMGQELPLFACMKMGRYSEDGLVVPLFMSHADCVKIAQADAAAPDGTPVEISALTLASVVEQLIAADPNAPKFSFVAPSAALQHIKSYMGGGVYMRPVETAQ